MKTLLLLGLAPLAFLAAPLAAQDTVTTSKTVSAGPAVVHKTVVHTHRTVTYGPRAHVNRHCVVKYRHNRRIRTCRTSAHID